MIGKDDEGNTVVVDGAGSLHVDFGTEQFDLVQLIETATIGTANETEWMDGGEDPNQAPGSKRVILKFATKETLKSWIEGLQDMVETWEDK